MAEWFDGYKTPEVRKLAMGRLLGELSRKMQHKASYGEKDPLKIAVHACHDTSLAGLCQTLDVFDGRYVGLFALDFEFHSREDQCHVFLFFSFL